MILPFVANAEDCTHGGMYDLTTCYGVQHGAITWLAVEGAGVFDKRAKKPVAAIMCGLFIAREYNGDGGMFKSADRALDWITPCIIGAEMGWGIMPNGIAFWRKW